MSYTNGNSSKASTKEVKETVDTTAKRRSTAERNTFKKERNNTITKRDIGKYSDNTKNSDDLKMGFKVSGGFFTEQENQLVINENETINQPIPMFEVVEKSFGTYRKTRNSKGRVVIVTRNMQYELNEVGKYNATPRKVAER